MGKIILSERQQIELIDNLIGEKKNDHNGRFFQMTKEALLTEIILSKLSVKSYAPTLLDAINDFNKAPFETQLEKASARKWIEFSPVEDLHEIFGSIWDDNYCREEAMFIIRKVAKAISKGEL